MHSEKKLLRALNRLSELFENSSEEADTDERMEAFNSGHEQCKAIIGYIESKDMLSALSAWKSLVYFADDSIGGNEKFLNKYQPIKQNIINWGLK